MAVLEHGGTKTERIVRGTGRFRRCVDDGAVFRTEDGVCAPGPCLDGRLASITLGGDVLLRTAMEEAGATCRS